MRVAIVGGSGKMGRWFADFLLKEGEEVTIIGRNENKLLEIEGQLNVRTDTRPEAVSQADIVLIAVPIDSFEDVIKHLQPHIQPEQFVIDITSVKVMPVEVMHRHIKQATVLGAHPVFGPGAKGVSNQNFVLTPDGEDEAALAEKIKRYLEEREARVTVMQPGEHDEMMAVILGLAHFIAIVSADTLLSFDTFKQMKAISGTTYSVLLTLLESVLSEDPELYTSLQANLPQIAETEERFVKNAAAWAGIVKNKERQEFARRMSALKDRMEKLDPDFGQAYEDMYRLLDK